MAKPLVFITGASGHIGFATLALVLKKGYRVRIASRRLATAQKLKDLPSVKPYADSLSVVEVADFTTEDAFDQALKDVEYVLHIASPIPDDAQTGTEFDIKKEYIDPAIQGNLGLLRAASKSPSVKRVVITSSVVILNPPDGKPAGPDDLAPLPVVEEIPMNPWMAYRASKILASAAVRDFIAKEKPRFDVVEVLPAYVQGFNEPVTSAKELVDRPSSNCTMILFALGHKETTPRPVDFVHVEDVAEVHVDAMEAEHVTSGERFIASYPRPFEWAEVEESIRKLFPEEVKNGILPLGGEITGFTIGLDVSKTVERFGIHFRGLDDMVQSLIGQYVDLVKKEKKA
jgi:nucleoside-diphosphate-sugar epimerase